MVIAFITFNLENIFILSVIFIQTLLPEPGTLFHHSLDHMGTLEAADYLS